jgi:hypothetical protein
MSDDGILHFNPWMDFNDGPPSENPFGCDPDPEQITVFLDAVYSWCEGLIPLRGFVDKGQGRDGKPHNIWVSADDTAPEKLATFAAWANREGAAVYVPVVLGLKKRARAVVSRMMLHAENTPALPENRKGQSGKVLLCPQQDYPATFVAHFCIAVLNITTRA